jgi:dipeptidyl aminopeptidase/acylaminoacyl peptidase
MRSRAWLFFFAWLAASCASAQTNGSNSDVYGPAELADVERLFDPRVVRGKELIVFGADKSGAFELWSVDPAGARTQLTMLDEKVGEPRPSPDGGSVIFSSDHKGDERYDLFRIALDSRAIENLTNTPTVAESGARHSPDGKLLAFEADPDIAFRPQIFLFDLATRVRRRLTSGDVPVYGPIWSPDGKTIAATRTGDWQKGVMLAIRVADGSIAEITPPERGEILVPVEFLDDHRVLALTNNARGFRQLALVDLRTRSTERFGPEKWDVTDAAFTAEAGIVFVQNVSGRSGLYRLASPNAVLEELLPPSGLIAGIEVARDQIVFVRQDGTHPAEIHRLTVSDRTSRRILSSSTIDSSRLSEAEPFRVESFDGTPIEGFAYRPKVARLGAPYPAIAWIHGGPNGQTVDLFNPSIQLLVQAGFFVVAPNYRGSTGYGRAFEDLNNKDWGGGDRRDVRAVLEHFVADGTIDRARIGITGGSYGGYMTLIALVKDADFFAAGADAFGMHDLVEDYEITKDRFGLWYETEMGTPKTDAALFADRSPIRHLDAIRAPLIVFQGANDTNVPKAESDRMVEAIRARGGAIDYVVYPDEGHGFTRRKNRLDHMSRTLEFFRSRLGPR